jgi:hypothetical protein
VGFNVRVAASGKFCERPIITPPVSKKPRRELLLPPTRRALTSPANHLCRQDQVVALQLRDAVALRGSISLLFGIQVDRINLIYLFLLLRLGRSLRLCVCAIVLLWDRIKQRHDDLGLMSST